MFLQFAADSGSPVLFDEPEPAKAPSGDYNPNLSSINTLGLGSHSEITGCLQDVLPLDENHQRPSLYQKNPWLNHVESPQLM